MTFNGLSHTGPQVGVLIHLPKMLTPPLSLNIARMEPVSVIHPTSADKPAATIMTVNSSCSIVVTSDVPSMNLQISERATSADARPTKTIEQSNEFWHTCHFGANCHPKSDERTDNKSCADENPFDSIAKSHLKNGCKDGNKHSKSTELDFQMEQYVDVQVSSIRR